MATLILGNISFEDGTATIHEAKGVIECETTAQAKAIGEILCNEFTAYVIPELFSGEIILEDSLSFVGETIENILNDL